jgi:hypothetical protein
MRSVFNTSGKIRKTYFILFDLLSRQSFHNEIEVHVVQLNHFTFKETSVTDCCIEFYPLEYDAV